jgi:hypothetical protein
MRSFPRHLIAAAALLAPLLGQTAYAQDVVSYPRVVGSGENASVEHGPGLGRNIVGGGIARVIGSGESASSEYQGPLRVQPSLFAHATGSGEQTQIIYSHSPDRETALGDASVLSFAPALAELDDRHG